MKNFIKTIFLISLFIPFLSKAALIYTSTGGSMTFELSPKNPGALTNLTITANSFEVDLNNANISWYLNDNLEIEGIAKKSFSFTTGKNGQITNIKAIAMIGDKKIEKKMYINPADVEIIWEANTYTPPFYKGKALASPKSEVKFVAIPHFVTDKGVVLQSENLNYEWSFNFTKITSGLGKNSAKATVGTTLGENIISVKVSNDKGDLVAEKQIKIIPENVFIAFYEDKPLDGTTYNLALGRSSNFNEKEINVRAEPFFFSYPDSASDRNLQFDWTLNGKGITPNEGTPKIITLRNESGREVLSSLGLTIRNIKKVFQDASASVLIKSIPNFNF